ncbi:MAG: pilin [Patescibacteria group bacterium]
MPKQIRKIIFILALGFVVFPMMPVSAADVTPALNPICWKKAECDKARASFLVGLSGAEKQNAAEGFVKGDVPCVGGDGEDAWGKCLPAGVTYTQISIGGQGKYANLGVYLQTIYNYALGIASVLAVVMIIVAGVQWTTSGGNTEVISSSKKRIVGSVVGLFIAYMSFFILNTINPSLTALRLPQVWLIKPQSLMPEYCSAAPSSTKFGNVGTGDANAFKNVKYDISLATDKSKLVCGSKFAMENGGNTTCLGDYCPNKGELCFGNKVDNYKCEPGVIGGKIMPSFTLSNSNSNLISSVKLYEVCTDGSIKGPAGTATPVKRGGGEQYLISGSIDTCGPGKTAGYFLGAGINDCLLQLTGTCTGGGMDWFAVGRVPGTNSCSINLANQFFRSFGGNQPDCSQVPAACTCGFLKLLSNSDDFKKNLLIPSLQTDYKGYLMSPAELQKGFICDILVDRSEFPSLPGSTVSTLVKGAFTGGLSIIAEAITSANKDCP